MSKKTFSAAMRSEMESSPSPLNAQILAELGNIEAKAKVLRSNKQNPAVHLAPEINDLKSRIYSGYRQASQDIAKSLEETKVKYEADQVKNAQKSLYKLEMAKLRINSLSDQEANQRAIDYETGKDSSLNYEEAQVLLSRVQDPTTRDIFKKAITETMLDQPWLETPELKEIARDQQIYDSLRAEVLIGDMRVDIEHVLDLDNEMEALA